MVSRKALKALGWMLVVVLAVAVAVVGFGLGYSYVLSQNARFARFEKTGADVGPDTPGAVMVIIPRGSDTKEIAAILAEDRIIQNAFLFTLLSKFNGFDGTYMAGTHFVKADMSYDEIMYALMELSGQEYVDMYATRAKELIAEGSPADSSATRLS